MLYLQGIPADPEKRLVDFLLENVLMNINAPNDPLPSDVAGNGRYIVPGKGQYIATRLHLLNL